MDAEQSKMAQRVLIVDDEISIREPIQSYLEMTGYACFTSDSGERAIELLRTEPVDAVITDIELPGISGLELTSLIKANHDTEVIVMTGYAQTYSYTQAIRMGASDFIFKPIRLEELALRLKRVLRERDMTRECRLMVDKLRQLSITDDLTGLYNSRHFFGQLAAEADRAVRYERDLALVMFDLDHFKIYNDAYGHEEGNRVLICFGKIIRKHLRSADSGYRYGGEEFTMILPETGLLAAESVAVRIQHALSEQLFFTDSGKTASITVSGGITQYVPQENLTDFIQRADRAMYMSKQAGRNRVTVLPAFSKIS